MIGTPDELEGRAAEIANPRTADERSRPGFPRPLSNVGSIPINFT